MYTKLSSGNMILPIISWLFLFIMFFVLEAAAQDTKIIEEKNDNKFPSVMSYEGYITNSDGTPFEDGNYDFTFAIYTEAAGGSPIWIEEHKSVTVNSGFIQLYLGRGTVPNPLNLPFDKQYYVGISVGETSEMTPRLELTSTGYSFRSKMADDVNDGSITTEKLAPHSVTDDKIKSVSWDKITDVPTGKVAELHNGEEDPYDPLNDQTHYIHSEGSIEMVFDRDNNSEDRTFSIRRDGLSRNGEGVEIIRVQENGSAIVKVVDTTNSTSKFTGALVVDGGVGIAKNLSVEDISVSTLNADTANIGLLNADIGNFEQLHVIGPGNYGPKDHKHVALFENNGNSDGDGIAIKVNNGVPNSQNSFITFLNQSDVTVGRIEGQNLDDLHQSRDWQFSHLLRTVTVGAYLAEAIACYANFPPDVAESIVNAVAAVLTGIEYGRWWIESNNNVGIAFSSGAGDYAEYLERLIVEEEIEAGDIVGVFGGKITKSTTDAQQLMVTSLAPIVLGNMPPESEEHLYEKIAFMGQLLVKIIGPVKEGDYIIPSGLEDGTGIAVSPEMMTADEFLKVVGRAWSTSDSESLKLVNVVVGLNSGDIASIVKSQMEDNQLLESKLHTNMKELQQTRSELAALQNEVSNLKELNQKVRMLQEAFENSKNEKFTHTVNNESESQ